MKAWGIGALNALISGAAASVGSWAAGTTLHQGLIIVTTASVVSFAKWMVQHPIPGGAQ